MVLSILGSLKKKLHKKYPSVKTQKISYCYAIKISLPNQLVVMTIEWLVNSDIPQLASSGLGLQKNNF